ncbi:hypothetical protein GCM10009117_20390 [Gangjinia marincola]|uniref:Uncharacterized protein n=1 Tax=Gangjinia marincola TaxID=578463 RepID=A0ABN1MIY6_9FLAO
MKKSQHVLKNLFLCLFTIALVISCDEVEELTQVDIDNTITENISVQVAAGDEDIQSFSKSMTIGIDNQEINNNRDKIEGLVINAMSYTFKNVNGNEEALVSGSLNIGGKIVTIDQTNPLEDQVNQIVTQIQDPSFLNDVAVLLKNNESIDLILTGNAENAPVDFTMELKLDVTATVEGL